MFERDHEKEIDTISTELINVVLEKRLSAVLEEKA